MIRIVTDTSANLRKEDTERLGIAVIPMFYYDDDAEMSCMDIDAFDDTIYYALIKKGKKIGTSQITPQRYEDFFRPYLEQGEDLLYIGMSSGISGSFDASQSAVKSLREEFPDRFIAALDTRGASLGEGLIVLEAAKIAGEMALFGGEKEDPKELYRRLLELRKCMYQVFVVDDLMHLKRTGRLSGGSALVGTLLSIKPVLKGNRKGQIVVSKSVRGRKKAIQELTDRYNMLVQNPENQTVGIAYAACREDAELLRDQLMKIHPPKDVMMVKYEPVTGSHVGPGALALFFFGDSEVRTK